MSNYFDIMNKRAAIAHHAEISKDLSTIIDERGSFYNTNTGGILKWTDARLAAIDNLVATGGRLPKSKTNADRLLFNDVSHSMRQLQGEYIFQTVIEVIANLHASLGHKFYGALLKEVGTTGHFVNPLHPLAAVHFLSDMNLRRRRYTVLVYTYKNRAELQVSLGKQPSLADVATIRENVTSLLVSPPTAKKEKRTLFIEHIHNYDHIDKATIYEKIKSASQVRLKQYSSYLVAHQVLARGVAVPYYGTSLLRKEPDTTTGIPLSPMLSSNISNGTGRVYRNICTASAPKTTLEGLSTLHHANMSSKLNSSIICTEALVYADICQHVSLTLYAKAGLVPSINNYTLPVTEELFTEAELNAYSEDPFQYTRTLLAEMCIEKARPILLALKAAKEQNENTN